MGEAEVEANSENLPEQKWALFLFLLQEPFPGGSVQY